MSVRSFLEVGRVVSARMVSARAEVRSMASGKRAKPPIKASVLKDMQDR